METLWVPTTFSSSPRACHTASDTKDSCPLALQVQRTTHTDDGDTETAPSPPSPGSSRLTTAYALSLRSAGVIYGTLYFITEGPKEDRLLLILDPESLLPGTVPNSSRRHCCPLVIPVLVVTALVYPLWVYVLWHCRTRVIYALVLLSPGYMTSSTVVPWSHEQWHCFSPGYMKSGIVVSWICVLQHCCPLVIYTLVTAN